MIEFGVRRTVEEGNITVSITWSVEGSGTVLLTQLEEEGRVFENLSWSSLLVLQRGRRYLSMSLPFLVYLQLCISK